MFILILAYFDENFELLFESATYSLQLLDNRKNKTLIERDVHRMGDTPSKWAKRRIAEEFERNLTESFGCEHINLSQTSCQKPREYGGHLSASKSLS